MTGSLLQSGRLVGVSTGCPSLIDIAIGLSRQPRFAGQTREWWSVLDHTLFCDELVQREVMVPHIEGAGDDVEAKRLWRIAVLLHDAHEALTGDCPSPLKPAELKRVQGELDKRIYGAFYPLGTYGLHDPDMQHAVHRIDLAALRAEACRLLPHPSRVIEEHFGPANGLDLAALDDYCRKSFAARPPYSGPVQGDHPAVREYLDRMLLLL